MRRYVSERRENGLNDILGHEKGPLRKAGPKRKKRSMKQRAALFRCLTTQAGRTRCDAKVIRKAKSATPGDADEVMTIDPP